MKQVKFIPWLGAFLVQLSNSFFYVSILNTGLLIITFWYTSGWIIANKYAPWMQLWHFALICLGIFGTVMIIDYKFMYPSRQGFINEQACKHSNPAMDELLEIRRENKELKQQLDKIEKALGLK